MGDKTGIQWTDATWNPIVGCSVVSPGCANCYAMKEARWLADMGVPKYAGLTTASRSGPVWNGQVRLHDGAIDQPLRWKKPRRIFVNSMSDLFHEELPDEAIARPRTGAANGPAGVEAQSVPTETAAGMAHPDAASICCWSAVTASSTNAVATANSSSPQSA